MPSRGSMGRAARHAPVKMKGELRLHLPFEEFSAKSTEDLVAALEKAKPPGATVEVSVMEDTHHSPCMSGMEAIVVQTVDPEGKPIQTYFMYQYCPTCKTAVRVL